MLWRRLLLTAGLIALAAVLAAPAGAATLGPASAGAATLGPAYFLKATGGSFTVPLHPDGLSTYPTSPAYLVLRADKSASTAAFEGDAAKHNFPWVAVPTTVRGRAGMLCFSNAQLVTAKSRVDAFTENHVAYAGMFLQYLSRHFAAGATKPASCAPAHGGLAAAPSVQLGSTSVNLHIDCLIKRCSGTFVSYSPARLCPRPAPVAGGARGCPPVVNGHFKMDGGLSVNFKLALKGRSPASILTAITVNGKRGAAVRLSSLPRQYALPARQHPATLSLTCPTGGTTGTPVTVSGKLSPGAPSPVTLTFVGSNTTQSLTATTDASGAFSARFTPTAGLVWVVDATFAGDRTRTHAERGCGFSVS